MDSTKSVSKTNKMPAKKETKTAPVAAETPVAAKAAPKPRKAPAAKSEVVVPVVEASAAAVAAPVVTDAAERSAATVLAALQDGLRALSAETTTRVRALVAEALEATKALKRDARNSKRRHKKDPATMTPEERSAWEARRANNAFLKLRPISDELASFMGLSPKSQRSQTDVTKFIATYVKTHSCFDPTFKRRILPDAKLGKLLRVKDGQEVTYLNLQSFLKVHFLKTDVKA
jgi:hypothetical protein